MRLTPASSSACPIRLGGDGDSLRLGSGRASEGAGVHGASRSDGLCGVGGRAGGITGRLPGLALIAVAVVGWLALAHHARRLTRVRTYRAGELGRCPL